MASRIRRIAVLTSGGDSPGSNACIRAVTRMALYYGWEPWGIRGGFEGLLHGEFMQLTSRSVSHVIGRGGTFLGSSRSDTFHTEQGLREAQRHINELGIDALVVIGGDGSQRGAHELYQAGVTVVGVPATIENDVCGTDVTIGLDTALNTALDAIDRIKDTASSHEQAFLVEVVGRQSGRLALMTAIAGGAEMVCLPDIPFTLDEVVSDVADSYIRGKRHCIIVVAAGANPNASEIAEYLRDHQRETGFGVRLSILGHIQRGGSPTANDRFLATRLGAVAVRRIHDGQSGIMVGLSDGQVVDVPLDEVVRCMPELDAHYVEMAHMLAR